MKADSSLRRIAKVHFLQFYWKIYEHNDIISDLFSWISFKWIVIKCNKETYNYICRNDFIYTLIMINFLEYFLLYF